MSRSRKSQQLDLKLNLSLLQPAGEDTSRRSSSVSSPGSCLSSESELGAWSSPASPATVSMVVAGCPQCLMYVMLSVHDLRCPKCRSTVLLYFCGDGDGGAATDPKSAHGGKKKA